MQPVEEPVQPRSVVLFRAAEFADGLADHRAVVVVVQVRPCGGDDAAVARHLPGEVAAKQARQNLAPGQIAGAAKDHEVEGIDRNDAGCHDFSVRLPTDRPLIALLPVRTALRRHDPQSPAGTGRLIRWAAPRYDTAIVLRQKDSYQPCS